MSRIEEALRRSLNRETSPSAEPRPAVDTRPGTDPFRSPWSFDPGDAEVVVATVAAPAPAQVAAPAQVVAPAHSPAAAPAPVAVPVAVPQIAPGPVPVAVAPPASSSTLAEPEAQSGSIVSSFNSQWKERLVVSDQADPFLVEQFRRLAATLHQAQISGGIKTVMITSATPSDGKTLTAINLALILSESYRRNVLLIDADLRRPSIRDTTHMPNVRGLSDGLRARTDQKLTVFRLTQNLSLLPAGRPDPDPMGSLTSTRMRRIIADASASYDWVVVDAPPVGTVADASILAEMVDGTLLVVRAGKTDCELSKKAIDAIGRERILGAVLNAVEDLDSTSYAQYYYAPRHSDGSYEPQK